MKPDIYIWTFLNQRCCMWVCGVASDGSWFRAEGYSSTVHNDVEHCKCIAELIADYEENKGEVGRTIELREHPECIGDWVTSLALIKLTQAYAYMSDWEVAVEHIGVVKRRISRKSKGRHNE